MESKLVKYKNLYDQICSSLTMAKSGVIELSGKNSQIRTAIHHAEIEIERETPKIVKNMDAKEQLQKEIEHNEREIIA